MPATPLMPWLRDRWHRWWFDVPSPGRTLPPRLEAMRRLVPLAGAALLLVAMYIGHAAKGQFAISVATMGDTDTLMRLAFIREIQAHGFQGGFFDRNDAPYGMTLHWTKPFYYLIIGMSRVFWFLPPQRALLYAGYWTGPIIGMATLFVAYWTGRAFLQQRFAAVAAIAITTCFEAIIYSQSGTANHHSLLLLVVLLLGGCGARLAAPGRPLSGFLAAGALAGFALWLSFELFPFAQALLLFLLYLWLLEGEQRVRGLLAFTTANLAVAMLALVCDPPHGGMRVPELDHVSLPYVLALACETGVLLVVTFVKPKRWYARIGLVAVLGAASLAGLFHLYPLLHHGLDGELNPIVRNEWLATIAEMMPATSSWAEVGCLGNAVAGTTLFMLSPPGPARYHVAIFALLAALTFAGASHLRLSVYAWAAGSYAAMACLQSTIAPYEAALAARPLAERAQFQLLVAAACLFVAFGCQTVGNLLLVHTPRLDQKGTIDCRFSRVLPSLNDRAWLGLAPGESPIFATDFDVTQQMLFWTSYRTLAGDFHEDARGLNDAFLMFRDFGDRAARTVIDERGIRYVMLCPMGDPNTLGTVGIKLFQKYTRPGKLFTQPTLYTRLLAGKGPDWLKPRPWPPGVKSDFKLWEVAPAKTTTPP